MEAFTPSVFSHLSVKESSMTFRLVRWIVPALALLAFMPLHAAEKLGVNEPIGSEARLKKDVTYLASDELEGRGVTTKGINLAADYIATEFKKAGLLPGGKDGSYFQPFTIPGATLDKSATLSLIGPNGREIELKAGTQFEPMGLAHSGKLDNAGVVFVGYGITSKAPEKPDDTRPTIDEYADLDVEGKVVIVLRDTMRVGSKALSGDWRRRFGALTEKMRNAEKHKAAAIIFVNDRDTAADGDDLLNFGFLAAAGSPVKLPAFHMRRALLEMMLGKKVEDIEREIDRDLKPGSTELKGWAVNLNVAVTRGADAIKVKNVVGVLEGKGDLAKETVIVGAHYDHVGYGGQASLAGLKKMAIHHGADDNGSGSTSVMELARRISAIPDRQGRRIVFMCFSGEELGLLGSMAYVNNPIFPLKDTVAMVNLDMVGRLAKDKDTGKERITVYGPGSALGFDALIDRMNKKYDFQLKKVWSGNGPSDQMSFYQKQIPVFFFFTNDHPDYHRPTDTADKINVNGMRRIVELTEELTMYLATVPERPQYISERQRQAQLAAQTVTSFTTPNFASEMTQLLELKRVQESGFSSGPAVSPGGGGGPRLGIRPDYGDDKEGVLLGGVGDGTPAAKAGMKEGDRIIEMGGKPVKNLEAYMTIMKTFKVGDKLEVTVLRDKEKKVLKVTLE
jgi:hypothetical protein